MKLFTKAASILLVACIGFASNANAQSILNPADPLITYDPLNPPAQPPWGQIGKWSRTVRMGWNTDLWKAYIYKNYCFRLKFPKTYNPTANDGKKYPIMLFFHGYGEVAPNTDNEFHLLLGHQFFQNEVETGNFDGYVLSIQSTGFFGLNHYQALSEIIDYMIVNNKLDPFHIVTNGLSAGGQATWDMMINHPTYVSAAAPMSWCSVLYTDPAVLEKIKFNPIWHFQGGLDGNPAPYTTNYVQGVINGAGGNMKNTYYPDKDHETWHAAWSEPDFFPFLKRAYASNPAALFGKTEYYQGEPINATIGIAPGYNAYQWAKRGVVISGATSNTLIITDTGLYQARVQRNGLWSEWSRTPLYIKLKAAPPLPNRVEAEAYLGMSGVQTETTADAGGGLNVGYIDNGDWMDYGFVPTAPGSFNLKLRVTSPLANAQLQIRKSDGTVLATVNVPQTGGWQAWQTVTSTNFTLPAQFQMLRIVSTGSGWNFNWLELNQAGAPPANLPPVSNAGTDTTLTLPINSRQLNGIGTDADGTISSYLWERISGPGNVTFTNVNISNPVVSALGAGTHTFKLTVTDNTGATATDNMVIIVNTAPVANAGPDQIITLPANTVQLRGSGTDADGSIAAYLWEKISGPGSFTNTTVQNPTVANLGAGIHTFRLTVTDNNGGTATDNVVVTVNTAPVANAGTDQAITSAITSVQLNGSGTDADGTITGYNWSYISGPAGSIISNSIIQNPIINNLGVGVYTYRLTVTDNNGGTATDDVVITVTVIGIPISNAGSDAVITLPVNSYQLNGSGTDANGTITGYSWAWISGPTQFAISNANIANPLLSNLTAGVYGFRLTVTDNHNNTATDDVLITVNNAPVSNAGLDQTISLPSNSVTLNGSGSDVDGSISGYLWEKISGPGSSTISNVNIANPVVNSLIEGVHTFRLTVTDNRGATATDNVVITVSAAPSLIHIEAENYSAMSGVVKENTLDAGGGQNVGYININDWMDYSVNIPSTGTYTMSFRTATPYSNQTFQVRRSDGTIITSVTAINSTGWQTWNTVSVVVSLTQGQQTLRLFATTSSGWNINWLEIVAGAPPPTIRIEAESFTTMSGIQTESTGDVGGGQNVGYIDNGDWMNYSVNPAATGNYTMRFRVASRNGASQLQVRKTDGTVLATVTIPLTGGWQVWQTVSATIALTQGVQTLRVFSTSAVNWNFNWMELVQQTGRPGTPEIITTQGLITVATPQAIRPDANDRQVVPVVISPNPVSDRFVLNINNPYSGVVKVQVINMNGAVLKEFSANKEKGYGQLNLSIGSLPKGQYILNMQMKEWKESKTILKL